MNDPTTTNDPDENRTTDDSAAGRSTNDETRFGRLSADDLRGLLDRVALAALVLLALVAGWNAYGYVGTAIRTWLDPAYQPIALAAFNVAVLLVALAGVIHQLRRLRGSEDGAAESAEPHAPADYPE